MVQVELSPGVRSYDPAFNYEVVAMQHGMQRMNRRAERRVLASQSVASRAVRRTITAGGGLAFGREIPTLGRAVIARARTVIDVRAGIDPDLVIRSLAGGRQVLDHFLASATCFAGRTGAVVCRSIAPRNGGRFSEVGATLCIAVIPRARAVIDTTVGIDPHVSGQRDQGRCERRQAEHDGEQAELKLLQDQRDAPTPVTARARPNQPRILGPGHMLERQAQNYS